VCQTTELSQRIRDAEKQVKRLVAEDAEYGGQGHTRRHNSSADPETQLRDDNYGLDGGSDDESDSDEDISSMGAESVDALEERFHGLEEEVANLVADVHDLALYTKLNITGFMKILKKHDVRPHYRISSTQLK
jgi:uncharacterized small protein (DUF1192 family)